MMHRIYPMNAETWLVCGGRDFANKTMFESAMSDVCRLAGCPSKIIHGGASGADTLAAEWAQLMAIDCTKYAADWHTYGRAAGPIRNRKMLEDGKPDRVVAFPGGRGTRNMMNLARNAGVAVCEVKETR